MVDAALIKSVLLLLILFVPQVLIFSLICTYCCPHTGNLYPGGLTAAALACWIVTGGPSFLQREAYFPIRPRPIQIIRI